MFSEHVFDYLKDIKVLLVEDDADLRASIERPLKRRCKALYCAANGKEGLELFREKRPHIVITDINLPKLNGLEMIKEIKTEQEEVSIIIITAFGSEENLVRSFDNGACSLLKKPIDLDELFMLLLANAKKYRQEGVIPINNDFSFHTRTQLLYHGNRSVDLTKKETKILSLLITNRGNPVSYEEFQRAVWGEIPMTLDALRMHINSIRKKSFQGIVKNFSGVGYRLYCVHDERA
ncbi:MAG: response regulator transcription factor [Wolinella sp.]